MSDEQLVTFAFLRKRTPKLVAIDTVGEKEKQEKRDRRETMGIKTHDKVWKGAN